MKKAQVVTMLIVLGFSGFLYYDWHTKTRQLAAEPSIPQYSWTDSKGVLSAREFRPAAGLGPDPTGSCGLRGENTPKPGWSPLDLGSMRQDSAPARSRSDAIDL